MIKNTKRQKFFLYQSKYYESKLLLISHLFLGEKTIRAAEGGNPNSFGKMGGNHWDALRASRISASSKPLNYHGGCIATFVNNRLIELTHNGRKVDIRKVGQKELLPLKEAVVCVRKMKT